MPTRVKKRRFLPQKHKKTFQFFSEAVPCFTVVYRSACKSFHSSTAPSGHRTLTVFTRADSPNPTTTRGSFPYKVTTISSHPATQGSVIAGNNLHQSAEHVATTLSNKPQSQPMILVSQLVEHQPHRTIVVGHQTSVSPSLSISPSAAPRLTSSDCRSVWSMISTKLPFPVLRKSWFGCPKGNGCFARTSSGNSCTAPFATNRSSQPSLS